VIPWYDALLLLVGCVVFLMFFGVPVAFAFLLTDLLGLFVFMRGFGSVDLLIGQVTSSITVFIFAPLPLFLLKGQIFFHSGLAARIFNSLDICLGGLPGRLCYVAVGGGSLFAALTGSSIANTAMMGSLMVPDMLRRGYSKNMALGPIMGAGGLAMMVPPSGPAVLLGSIAKIDIGGLLLGAVLPGILLASLYVVWIALKVHFDPGSVPPDSGQSVALAEKLRLLATNILPTLVLIVGIIALMEFGIATPSEAAAFGVVGTLGLTLCYGAMTWRKLWNAMVGTSRIAAMVLLIIMTSHSFAGMLAFSGASSGLIDWVSDLHMSPLVTLCAMLGITIMMGTIIDGTSIMLMTVPIFFPLAQALGLNLIWFGVLMLISIELGLITPPKGLLLYVMMSVAPRGTTLGEVAWAAVPFIAAHIVCLGLLIAFPLIVLSLAGTP
jgi:tripartite ATP-independent transporter DctM subunit